MKAIILAGGRGTRLWPVSTETRPKQFLDINGKGELLLQTLQRCSKFGAKEQCFVVTREDYALQASTILNAFDSSCAKNVIIEPFARNTAPALLLAAKFLQFHVQANLDDVVMVFPSDHLIQENEKLISSIALGERLAQKGYIITFGIIPNRPETGYGYIKANYRESINTETDWLAQGLSVAEFKEKPDLITACQYLDEGGYFWNAGIFALTLRTLLTELQKHLPIITPYLDMNYETFISRFDELPDISIDYAIMEKTDRSVVIPLDVFWSDVGSWDSVYEILPKDSNGNGIQGQVLVTDTTNSLLINQTGYPMAALGLQDVIAIQTDRGMLIVNRGDSQAIKHIIPQSSNSADSKVLA